MALGNTLAELRKKSKLTQSELGEKLNISAQAISKWENNLSEPDIDTIKKLAAIYGVAISDILEVNEEAKPFDSQASKTLYDVYITAIDVGNSFDVMVYLTDMLGLDISEAESAVNEHPYLIARSEDAEKSSRISAALSTLGAKVTLEPVADKNSEKTISNAYESKIASKDLWNAEKSENTKPLRTMHKRFVVANVTAAVPALAVMILILSWSSFSSISVILSDVLFSVCLCVCLYSLIFLAWYPTFTRKFFAPINSLVQGGIFGTILFMLLILPWILIALVIAPINYIFAIKTRIERMKTEDLNDDVFFIHFINN